MKRIIAMLLAIVMLVGNIPGQAFATEAEPLVTEACVTEGCTYGAGHTGECSTFVACDQEGCTFAAGHEGNCSNSVTEEEPKADPAADAAVYVTVSDRGELGMAYEEVTVTDINADGKLSVDEALYAAHTVYGKGYTSQEGTVTQLWDVETTNVSFFVNHEVISLDVNAETVSDGDYLVASVDQDAVNDYDKYSRFDVLEASVKAGEEFALILTDDAGNALAGMEIGLWGGNGSTTMTGLTTDVNGSVTLALDQEGQYCITAKGTVAESSIDVNTMEITSIETPIIAPVCVVTVSGAVMQQSAFWASTTATRSQAAEAVTTDGDDVSIYFSVVDAETGDFIFSRQPMTVSSGTGAAYGWMNDDIGETMIETSYDHSVDPDECTPIDALIRAHELMYGDSFTAETIGDYLAGDSSYVTGFFQRFPSGGISFRVNGRVPADGDGCDYAANEYVLQNGDELVWLSYYSWEYYNEYFTYFTDTAGTQVYSLTAEAGTPVSLMVHGVSCGAWGEVAAEPMSYVDILPAAVNEFGATLGETALTTTDENGAFSYTFPEAGTYCLSAKGQYTDMDGTSCNLIMPWCEITVTASACQHTETETKYTPIPGETKHTAAVTCTVCGEPLQESVTEDCIDENSDNACDLCEAALPVAVESITLDQTTLEMTVGDAPVTLTATVLPENAAYETINWTSDNLAVATVSDGAVTAVSAGIATITAKAGDRNAACTVTVNPAVVETSGITIDTGHAAEYITEFYLSRIVLQGLEGTVSGADHSWSVELPENTPTDQPITFVLTASLMAPAANFSFFANDVVNTQTIGDANPGTITLQPVWENGRATVSLGIWNNKTGKQQGKAYTLELSIAGLVKEDPNTIELKEVESKKYFAKDFVISDAVVSAATVSGTDFSGSSSGHTATIDVVLAQMPAGTFALTMNMMKTGSVYVSVNGADRAELDGSCTIGIDLSEATSYTLITYSTKSNSTIRGTYTINFSVEGMDLNAAPMLKDSSNFEAAAEILTSQTYSLNLASLFTDTNGDALTYTVQIDDTEPVSADAQYVFAGKEEGKYVLVFRASDGKVTSEDCYTVYLSVVGNTPPYLVGENTGTDTMPQYSTWSIDLTKIFADDENNGITYTVSINGASAVGASANYSYTPEKDGTDTLVFWAQDDSGAQSEEYTVTLTVNYVPKTTIDTSCNGTVSGDTWIKSISVTGVEVVLHKWNAEAGHTESDEHVLNICLSEETPDDAQLQLNYTAGYASSFTGSVSGPDSVTLAQGEATATVTTTGWMNRGTTRTYTLNFTNKANSAPVASAASAEVSLTTGDAFTVNLKSIFSDAEDEALRYTLTVDGQETDVDAAFSRTISTSGTQVLVFTAYDSWGEFATYTVTVTASQSEATYDVSLLIPEGITPSFYVTGSFDGENGDTLGDALAAAAGETANGFTAYTVAVPETVSRISFRGIDADGNAWGGMSVATAASMEPVTVIQLSGAIPSKVNSSYVTAQQALFQLVDKDGNYVVSGSAGTDDYGIVNYRFLVVACGTDDLAKAYTAYVVPQGDLAANYATSIGSNKTFVKDQPQQITTMSITPKSSFTITAPEGALVQVFRQNRYYNSTEIQATTKQDNGDGTVSWVFEKGTEMYMSYRASMADKITKAGYVKGDSLTITWDDNDPSPTSRAPYDTSTLYGSRGDDSLVLNVNSRNNLVLNSGDTFRLRAYRIWEVINSDTQNVMIQPDMAYTLSGDHILGIVPVTSGNGNGKNNWLDLTASGTGVAYLEMSYRAMQIVTGNMSGFGGDELGGFAFNASDPDRTGLVVVQVGNAATDVNFGIQCTSFVNNNAVSWDAEFDTLYFTGDQGQLKLTPSVGSGSIAEVAVSADKGTSWTALTAADGVYTAGIVSGNNIIRITKSDGTQAYQVVRGDKITVSVTGGDGDSIVEAGESYRIQLHGLHNPIGKMAGNYNPGYQAGQHVTYEFNNSSVTTSINYQYDFVSNAWVDVTIPADAQEGTAYLLEDGYISFNIMGIGEVYDDTKNHRSLTDDGCTTRASGGSSHQRSILPEITLTVGRRTDGTDPTVAVESVTLDKTELTMIQGSDPVTLTATVLPANATDKTITWTSDNLAVAQVVDGTVTANGVGSATITAATANGKTAACEVTVTEAVPETPELDFGLAESDIVGYATVSFVDNGTRLASDLAGMEEQFRKPLGIIVAEIKVPFKPYDTIAAVTLRLLDALNISASYSGNENSGFYLSSIGNFTVGETTYASFGEFDAGAGSGWMITQNDVFIGKGASEFQVKDGDVIAWQYTCQLGVDIGDTFAQQEVDKVEALIEAIGQVTLESEVKITAAREAYNELNTLQQSQVKNFGTLTTAEAALEALKANEADKEAANQVINMIEAIDDEVTAESRDAIKAARAAYDALTDARKALVTNYAELEAAEEMLELLDRVDADIANIYKTTGDYLAGKNLGTGSTNGEWAVLGLARSGRSVADSYYKAAVAYVKENISNGRLHIVKSTENSRLILALTAIGKDVTNVDGHNLLTGLNDLDYIGKQGVNGPIYTLIALDSHDYAPVGVTREDLINAILAKQQGDGGWSLLNASEVDLTAMAIQSLAPYYGNAAVKSAVDKALSWLSNAQNQDGSFSTTDGPNAESIAQVIVALTALGINPDEDSRFVKNTITAVQALAQFYVEGGGFEHTEGTGRDDMATEQGYYALAAYARFKAGQTALYDMSDVVLETEKVKNVEDLIDVIDDEVTQETKAGIDAAREAYEALDDTLKSQVNNLAKLENAETAYDQLMAKAVADKIDAIGVITLDSEQAIKEAEEAYEALTETQKEYVTNYDKLTEAKKAWADLKSTEADRTKAEEVKELIEAIGQVTLDSEAKILEARTAYEALTDVQKPYVDNLETLESAEETLTDLKHQKAADDVERLIDNIGQVELTTTCENAINAARRAYNALTTIQKGKVDEEHLKTLKDAETTLAALKDQAAADTVKQKIDAIGDLSKINLGSESKIKTARNAYNALTAAQKALVSNYQTLEKAEEALDKLKSTVSVTFSLLGCYQHGNTETTVHTLAGGNLQTWIPAKTYKVKPGATVKDLFEQALKEAGLTWKNPTGNYVESITRNGVTIGEFTNGTYSGWMYTLNGKHPGLGVNQQTLSSGNKVVFHYTDDYRKEEGSTGGTTGSTTSGTTTGGTTNYITTTTTTVNTEMAESVDRLIEDIGEEITLDSEAKILAARAAYDKLTEAQKKLVEKYDVLVEAEAKLAQLKGESSENVYIITGDYMQGLGTPGVGAIGGEWMVIGLARSGRSVPTGYYDHVLNYVRENINEKEQLHSAKSSDNSRMIMALTAIGKDVTNVDGHNLLVGLNDMDYIQKQGINGPIWALLAFDSGNYPVPEGDVSREKLIDVILEAQLSDGGWALSGERSDPDMTGMAIQALASYMQSHAEVKKAVEAAVWTLSKIQNDNGSFTSVDGPNSESIAQVIVALAALGIDADTDARFVKNGISALDALLTYYIPGGGFRHVLDGNLDGMSTEQAYYALVAYNRMLQNEKFLYDMTDVIDAGGDVIVEETTEPTEMSTEPISEEEEDDNGNAVVIWTGVMTACAAVIAVLLLNRKKLFGKFL